MLITFKVSLFLLLSLCLVSPVIAEQVPASANQGKYIDVTFEIYGLDESAGLLKKASQDLAKKLSQIDPNPEEMTLEELQALSSVIQEANRLIQSIDASINQAGQAIESLVSDTLIAVNQSTIEPAIQSVDDSVTRWLIITFSGIFLVVAAAGYYIYLATRQIRSMAKILKSITEDYEIVPKRANQETTEAGDEDSTSTNKMNAYD
jgi:DNA-binding ferritin-like protein